MRLRHKGKPWSEESLRPGAYVANYCVLPYDNDTATFTTKVAPVPESLTVHCAVQVIVPVKADAPTEMDALVVLDSVGPPFETLISAQEYVYVPEPPDGVTVVVLVCAEPFAGMPVLLPEIDVGLAEAVRDEAAVTPLN